MALDQRQGERPRRQDRFAAPSKWPKSRWCRISRARMAWRPICRRCKYVFVNGELETDHAGNYDDPAKYRSMVAFLDAQTLETKFEVSFVGNADIASSGKDGRYVFVTMYNTENGDHQRRHDRTRPRCSRRNRCPAGRESSGRRQIHEDQWRAGDRVGKSSRRADADPRSEESARLQCDARTANMFWPAANFRRRSRSSTRTR